MSREVPVRFCEGLAGKFRRSTLLIAHCSSEKQAQLLKTEIGRRLSQCRLELHPEKTKIVYCKGGNRQGSYQNESFDFLGYTFRPRRAKSRSGHYFVSFSPAVSNKASVTIRRVMRSWFIHRRSDKSLEQEFKG